MNNGLDEYVKVIAIISVDMGINAEIVDIEKQKELEAIWIDKIFFYEIYNSMLAYEELSYLDLVNLLKLTKKKS